MNTAWLFAGGAALTGLIATGWGYLRSLYQYFLSWMIISISVQGYQSDAVQLYLREKFTASKFGPRVYAAWLLHVRPVRRTQLVSMEVIGNGGRLFWLGWRPMWVAKSTKSDDSFVESGVTARDYEINTLLVTFPRGLFVADELILAATEFFNRRMMMLEQEENDPEHKRRHYVKHVFGTVGKSMDAYYTGNDSRRPSSSGDTRACMHHRPIGWSLEQLGSEYQQKGSPIDNLALDDNAIELVEEARFWKANEKWYRDRSIPWRRGWLLHGPPGTGKTALIRAIAEELDLPVYIYDLASMFNLELQSAWSKMLSEVPCMAVIEDIDAVFQQRENIVSKEHQSLTFDCLLNCLDGIQKCNGLFVAITTNQIKHIDPALGSPVNGVSSRPGRIDRTLHLGALSEASRIKIASRILFDRVDLQLHAVDDGNGDTAACFQERCSRYALAAFWEKCCQSGNRLVEAARPDTEFRQSPNFLRVNESANVNGEVLPIM